MSSEAPNNPHQQGYIDYLEDRHDCPYAGGTQSARQWEAGYFEAFQAHQNPTRERSTIAPSNPPLSSNVAAQQAGYSAYQADPRATNNPHQQYSELYRDYEKGRDQAAREAAQQRQKEQAAQQLKLDADLKVARAIQEEGASAYDPDGKLDYQNPYAKGSNEHRWFERGYRSAREAALPKKSRPPQLTPSEIKKQKEQAILEQHKLAQQRQEAVLKEEKERETAEIQAEIAAKKKAQPLTQKLKDLLKNEDSIAKSVQACYREKKQAALQAAVDQENEEEQRRLDNFRRLLQAEAAERSSNNATNSNTNNNATNEETPLTLQQWADQGDSDATNPGPSFWDSVKDYWGGNKDQK